VLNIKWVKVGKFSRHLKKFFCTASKNASCINLSMSLKFFLFKSYHPTPWRDSISRPIAPVSSVAGGTYVQ
jgi:hypothetical protein